MRVDTQTIRLDKYLSNRGFTSRRNIKKFLKENTVTIDGNRIRESGFRFNTQTSQILINNKKPNHSELVYFILHKPLGVISTASDEFGRENVVSLIKTKIRVYPVGRLDKDTSGLIILTNDGELTHKLTHPKYHVPKVYRLLIGGKLTPHQKKMFTQGVMLSDGITNPTQLKIIKESHESSLLEAILHEGRYRQIRRMCEKLGITLLSLERIKFGEITLSGLKTGEYRELTKKEIESLREAVESRLDK